MTKGRTFAKASCFLVHEFGEEAVKMVRSPFSGYGVTSMVIKTGTDSLLNMLHNVLVFHFYSVEIGTCSFMKFRFVPYVHQKRDLSPFRRFRSDDVDR